MNYWKWKWIKLSRKYMLKYMHSFVQNWTKVRHNWMYVWYRGWKKILGAFVTLIFSMFRVFYTNFLQVRHHLSIKITCYMGSHCSCFKQGFFTWTRQTYVNSHVNDTERIFFVWIISSILEHEGITRCSTSIEKGGCWCFFLSNLRMFWCFLQRR